MSTKSKDGVYSSKPDGCSSAPKKPLVYIKTYGCQMNVRDSETVSVLLERHGYILTGRESEADVVIVNTCSVRGKAEDKALGKLGLLVASKRGHPDRIVGAMGCMVQRLKSDMFQKVRGLDFAVGTHRLSTVPSVVDAVRADRYPFIDISGDTATPLKAGQAECLPRSWRGRLYTLHSK